MIIGISGKIGSGKDTVGRIIQMLIAEKSEAYRPAMWSLEALFSNRTDVSKYLTLHSNVEIKKFADTLKDIVCMLIGCTREQLENQEFKNTELGEEWNCYKYQSDYNVFSLTLDKEKAYYLSYSKPENIIEQRLTPRLLLQLLGTECGRDIIHPNIWVNALFSNYIPKQIGYEFNYSHWIITDMRFPNELKAVKSRGGITIRVNRNTCNCVTQDMAETCNNKCSNNTHLQHSSETALDNAEFDYTIENNGTIEELIEKVKEILIKEKIINGNS